MSGRTRNHSAGNPSGSNPLKNAEMALEGNYNQIDGLINNEKPRYDLTNGQSYEDLRELAPETLPEEKLSVLERLAQAKVQAEALPEPEEYAPLRER
ncbi:hypothetical protein OXPF_15560 [Oxobacter pfennigii]|uniref:DUF4316 domain-containing protein n=1 Tax=Oxobacter pfennigii TaxID=36849 RepID=A0A0P8X2Q3_9CLOT|nr:DUF4316 domain-containing protein [Oxobacter pfennigii]KPU45078.1 hypothetical protein OXPF_15560 [Oxobacter pfennigii]